MKARTALLELFRESHVWRSFFRSCCETSAFRLRSQTWQFREDLKERAHGFLIEEVEDALLGLARDLLPDTPAASGMPSGHTSCARVPSLTWRSATPSSPMPTKKLWTSPIKACGTSGCMQPDWRTTRPPSGWR